MVKMDIILLGLVGAGMLFILSKKQGAAAVNTTNTNPDQIITATNGWVAAQSPVFLNNAETETLLGNNNPFTSGPQSVVNPASSISTTDYSAWGGTLAQGGAQFAWINGQMVRNPSAMLIFDRGLGVYR